MFDKKGFINFLMDSGVLIFGDFVTKSGRKSPYFVNTGNFTTGIQLATLGKYYANCIVENIKSGKIPDDVNVLFGPAYKGIPLSVTTAISLAEDHGHNLNYCFNRKEQKDHGEGGSLVGHKLRDGDKILIIEDVITAGTAVRETLPALKSAANIEVCGLIISVDRMEKGTGCCSAVQEIYEEFKIPTYPIVNIKEIFDFMPAERLEDISEVRKNLQDYMREYCI